MKRTDQPSISLLTIVKGRRAHLDNLLRGVRALTRVPSEVIIVHMNEPAATDLADAGCPVRQFTVESEGHNLPLALARNRAARAASGELLVFLDVACIPAPNFLADLSNCIISTKGLVMGTVHYLPAGSARQDWQYRELERLAVPHPRRPQVPPGACVSSQDYHLFWSLCFGLGRETFQRIGGFDENFVGYGGEDTDFAFAARQTDVPFYLADARCFHQYHATYSPPYNHLEDIVVNAKAFREKWERWPMEGWLAAFQDSGHVAWEGDELKLLRPADAEWIDRHRSTDPFA